MYFCPVVDDDLVNLFVDVMNQSVLMDSDNTVLVELMVMFGDHS